MWKNKKNIVQLTLTVLGVYMLGCTVGPSRKHLSPGAIVGIVLGAAALVGLVAALLLTIILRHQRTSAAISAQMARCKPKSCRKVIFVLFGEFPIWISSFTMP
jgi:hypothetical protein